MRIYEIVCYVMRFKCYGMSFKCYAMRLECYVMMYVVQDMLELTVLEQYPVKCMLNQSLYANYYN